MYVVLVVQLQVISVINNSADYFLIVSLKVRK